MNDPFLLIVWAVISLSHLAIGLGCSKGGKLLRPHGSLIRAIGWAFIANGLFGAGTAVFAFVHDEIPTVTLVRTAIATLFWPGIAIAVIFTAYRFNKLPLVDRTMLVQLHEAAFGLEKEMKRLQRKIDG